MTTAATRTCPRCSAAMAEKLYEGVVIDACTSCGASWLDQGEVTQILKTREARFSVEERQKALADRGIDLGKSTLGQAACPVCSEKLARFEYLYNSGVQLERCPNSHGLLFDRGELERIQIFVEENERHFKDSTQGSTSPVSKGSGALAYKHCPVDGSSLREFSYEEVKIDGCPKCLGLWCDGTELAQIIASREQVFTSKDFQEIAPHESTAKVSSQKDTIGDLLCVTCGIPLTRHNFSLTSGLVIDSCPRGHGVWLDKDELDKVQVFSERWESQESRIVQQYGAALKKVRAETESNNERNIASIRVSRFGVVNRFIQLLARAGLF